jgi:thymidine phosphorylase
MKKTTRKSINKLKVRRLGIDTQKEHVAYIRADSHIIISEGFEALTRVRVTKGKLSIVASLQVVILMKGSKTNLVNKGEIGLSEMACTSLGVKDGDNIEITHLEPLTSLGYIRAKIYGKTVESKGIFEIVDDVVKGNYSNVHLSSFITAFAGDHMNLEEIISLTKAMIISGDRIKWDKKMVVDKHCIGGLPGNRTTPIVVSIVSALGFTMPKTSSRAITSPAGTADTMEVMAPVNLSMEKMKEVVEKVGGCIVWGSGANLSPADDILIRIERALDLDSEGQLIASVLSKKVAAGSTHLVVDMPVGETVKLRSIEAANHLKIVMEQVGTAVGLKLKIVVTDGSQPVGVGLGPSLEAMDILSILRNEKNAPPDLKERSLLLTGELLELAGYSKTGKGFETAGNVLSSGDAYKKFIAICKAQGGFIEPGFAKFRHDIRSAISGTITSIDNRKISRIAKLAGAPDHTKAGMRFFSPLGKIIKKGDVLYTIFTETAGELEYALQYEAMEKDIISIK